MMNILVTFWVKPVSMQEKGAAEREEQFDREHPIPDFMKITRLGWRLTEKGLKAVEIYEVEDGRLEEAMQIQYEREVAVAELHEGNYKSEMEVLVPIS